MKKVTITISGPAGTGKSKLQRLITSFLNDGYLPKENEDESMSATYKLDSGEIVEAIVRTENQ